MVDVAAVFSRAYKLCRPSLLAMSEIEQLSDLLGRKVKQIRKTDEVPPRISVIDVTVVITGQDANNAAKVLNRVRERFSDVTPFWSDVKFPDARGRKGQKATPVACVRGIVMTLMVLPGIHAANIRRRAAQLLVRFREN